MREPSTKAGGDAIRVSATDGIPAVQGPATGTREDPDRIVLLVMGVSGSGKSTVASLLAKRLGWVFVDGDTFHTPERIAKMKAGIGLDDTDRAPWLAAMADWIDARLESGDCAVMACSALKRAYRRALTRDRRAVRIVYLAGSRALIDARLAGRRGHFMPARLLDSQFAILEPPGPEEGAIVVGIEAPPHTVVGKIMAALGLCRAPLET